MPIPITSRSSRESTDTDQREGENHVTDLSTDPHHQTVRPGRGQELGPDLRAGGGSDPEIRRSVPEDQCGAGCHPHLGLFLRTRTVRELFRAGQRPAHAGLRAPRGECRCAVRHDALPDRTRHRRPRGPGPRRGLGAGLRARSPGQALCHPVPSSPRPV